MNKTSGKGATDMVKMELTQALKEAMLKAPEDKHDCWLMSHGYSSESNEYHRGEGSFNRIDTILLDFDNEDKDKDLKTKFEDEYNKYDYIIWESASSTSECPKFRVLFLMDKPIEFLIGEDGVKYTKKAIVSIFAKYKPDKVASWFYTPTKSKLNTVKHNRGIAFPSASVSWMAMSLMKTSMLRTEMFENEMRNEEHTDENKQRDVSNNDKVRHYLDTSYTKITGNGDSDSSLYRAICVCVTANDESTLDSVLNKAMMEHWSRQELERKVKQARRFVRK